MPLIAKNLAWASKSHRKYLATVVNTYGKSSEPQTAIEKVVQKYALNLPPGKFVRAGDYVMIRPEYVMTHDNTGPVITKCVNCNFYQLYSMGFLILVIWSHNLDSNLLAQRVYTIRNKLSLRLTMMFKTSLRRIWLNMRLLKFSPDNIMLTFFQPGEALVIKF